MARILIVEDDESDRLLQRSILEGAGHDTLIAKNGAEALVKYGKYGGLGIDVVVTDLQMPSFGGLELIEVLARLSPRPRIIAISALGEEQLDKARTLGASVALAKPVTADALLAAVAGLGEWRSGRGAAGSPSG